MQNILKKSDRPADGVGRADEGTDQSPPLIENIEDYT